MTEITERREVRVQGDDTTFVFVAEPDAGRLRIEEHGPQGEPSEVCAVTLSDRGELSGFLEGLARVLGVRGSGDGGAVPRVADATEPAPAVAGGGDDRSLGTGPATASVAQSDDEDRDAIVERARARNPQAFKSWTPDEERRVREAYEAGTPVDQIAREVQRSRRAVEMRLEKMGARPSG
jgi:hypothetical protein